MALTRHDSARGGAGATAGFETSLTDTDPTRKLAGKMEGLFSTFAGVFARPGKDYPHFYVPGGCTALRLGRDDRIPGGKTPAIFDRWRRAESPRGSKTPSPRCVNLPFEV